MAEHTRGRTSGSWAAAGQRGHAEPRSGFAPSGTIGKWNGAGCASTSVPRPVSARRTRCSTKGRRRSERGTDVVVGLVETHGRAKTAAAIGDLEVVPRRRQVYRGLSTEDMDLEAVLARRPDVALVDELAHTNVPGGPHAKRWQDVHDLLDAGIDVITTVNIQHLESLNDVVEGITGVRQRETVPDAVVRGADAVELVDMSPQALRRRLAHGNVYPADRVDTALAHYFREGNLAALRELALLWLADRVDEGLERYRGSHGIDATWATRERVLAGVSGGGESEALMRRAARIASRTTGGEWQAVLVTTRDGLSSAGAHRSGAAAGRGRGHGRQLPRDGRRRPGRGPARLRPRDQRHPGDHRRQPALALVDPAAAWRRRADDRPVR